MNLETSTGQRWACDVAPYPAEGRLFSADHPSTELPGELAAYHAARAYGFWLAVEHFAGEADPENLMGQAVRQLTPEYSLASMWWQMACTDSVDVPALALDVVEDLAAPHVLGPNLVTILEWANIDPAEIRPYLIDQG